MTDIAGPFALLGLILLGIAVLWARQVVYRRAHLRQQDAMRLILSLIGSLLILIGVLGAAAQSLWVFAPVGCVIALGVALLLVMRYRAIERRAMLRCIAIAAEKGIPLHHAVRSFADERTDELGYRATILADDLERGMSLPEALQHSKTRLPIDALLAVRLGYETKTLGPAVARVARHDHELDLLTRSLVEKYLYLGAMTLSMVVCVSFFSLKIAPVMQRMFQEFDLELPLITQWNLQGTDWIESHSLAVLAMLGPIVLFVVVVLSVGALHYLSILPHEVPGTGFVSRRFDAALVMRAFAMAIAFRWPLNRLTWLLARLYPKRSVRGRLAAAGRRLDNGEDWCTALHRAGIIGRADRLVLEAAQRVGNLEWALEEMSSRSVYRLVYRWRLVINVAFPLVLLLFGLMVAFFVVGFFAPLVRLIEGLT